MPTKGPTLRIERLRAKVKTTDLAVQMGISRATLYTLEQSAVVDPKRVIAYREAVKALSDATEGNAA